MVRNIVHLYNNDANFIYKIKIFFKSINSEMESFSVDDIKKFD